MFGRESLKEFIRREQEKSREFFQRHEEESREFFQRHEEESREFQREILLRNEKVYQSAIAGMESLGQKMESLGRRMEGLGREMEEGRKQIQANTEAVLRLLDRFEGEGGAPA